MSLFSGQPHFLLLAQIDVPAEPGNIVVTLSLVAILVAITSGVVTIWALTRPKPSVKELVEGEVTKVEGRLEKRLDELAEKLETVSDEQSDKRYKIYQRIERETKDLYRRVEAEQASTRAMITAFTNTVNKSFQDIQRDLGRIEAKQQQQ